jgi:hypothetical protein
VKPAYNSYEPVKPSYTPNVYAPAKPSSVDVKPVAQASFKPTGYGYEPTKFTGAASGLKASGFVAAIIAVAAFML